MAVPTALVGGAAAPPAPPPPPKNDVLQQLGVEAIRTRMQDLRSTIERIIHTFHTNPSSNWAEALAQFSIVNVELLSLVDDIKLVLKQFVVYPKNVSAGIAPILPIMLSSKLLPELEAEEATLKEQVLTPLSNLTHHVQVEKLQKHIELVRAVCDAADKALSDSRKSLGFTGRQGMPLAPALDKLQAAKILDQEKLLHAAANFGEGLRIPPDQRNVPATVLPPHIASALASADQAAEGNKAPLATMRAAVSQQGNASVSLNVTANSPRPGNLAELHMQHSLQQQQPQQRPSMAKVAQRFPHQRFPQVQAGQQPYQPVKMHQYPQSHQIHQQLQQQQLQQHIQLHLQQQGHAISQGNQLRNFGSAPGSSLLSSSMAAAVRPVSASTQYLFANAATGSIVHECPIRANAAPDARATAWATGVRAHGHKSGRPRPQPGRRRRRHVQHKWDAVRATEATSTCRLGLVKRMWVLRAFCSVARAERSRLLVVQPRLHPPAVLKARLAEAVRLAESLQKDAAECSLPSHVLAQRPSRIHAGAYFGAGTIENVRIHMDALDAESGVDAVFVNAPLSGAQQRNLERAWGKPVLDRVGLIIEIFGSRARTKEAKLQVELAALDYKKSRLVRVMGKGSRLGFGAGAEEQVVSARGRASGGQGFMSGSGEAEIQLQRRRLAEKKTKLEALLSKVRQTRSLHRNNRQGIPLVAVVGYTNAGKSTLVAALSKTAMYSDDRLFATLDTQLRNVHLPTGRKALFSDTVGFISDLPVQLVEAFRATLEEVLEADILLHVMDSSAPDMEEQRAAVLQVLKDIGISDETMEHKMIEVLNKVDVKRDELDDKGDVALLDGVAEDGQGGPLEADQHEQGSNGDDQDEQGANVDWQITQNRVPRIAISATQGAGLDNLLHVIAAKLHNN